jgi:hypothetical protein
MYVPFSRRDIYIHSEDRYILQTVQKDLEIWQTLELECLKLVCNICWYVCEQMHYGVCVADLNNDGKMEFFVCGFADQNQLLKVTDTLCTQVLCIDHQN